MKSSFSMCCPVSISFADISSRHCSGMLNLSRSDGRTPSHLMSGVVRFALSNAMFFEPCMYTEMIFSPYGSASTSASTGMRRSRFSLLRNRRVATSGWPLAVIMTHGKRL